VCVYLLSRFSYLFAPLYSQVARPLSPQPTIKKTMAMKVMSTEKHVDAGPRTTLKRDCLKKQATAQLMTAIRHHAEEKHNVLEACGLFAHFSSFELDDAKKPSNWFRSHKVAIPTTVHDDIFAHILCAFTSIQPRAPPRHNNLTHPKHHPTLIIPVWNNRHDYLPVRFLSLLKSEA